MKNCKRLVIKIGTATLTHTNGKLNLGLINKLALYLADLQNQGKELILVSSGAIGVGSKKLGFSERPKSTQDKQAAAAIGQAMLMQIYQNAFSIYGVNVAQILLTKDDFEINQRKINTQNTLNTLLDNAVLPIINANDTISTYEIEFSDNDSLSASVALVANADLLIILSDIDALYSDNPKLNPNAKRIPRVKTVDESILKMAQGKGSEFSIGGMLTKLEAARTCAKAGIKMAIINGEKPENIGELLAGADIGTIFN